MKRAKTYTELIDTDTGELMIAATLTPAAIRRMIREYQRWGYYLAERLPA